MQLATVYKRKGAYYVHSDSQTTDGVWIAVRPFLRISVEEGAAALVSAMKDALRSSRTNIEHPTNWDSIEYPIPELAGVKSWATFMRNACCLSVKADGGKLLLIPNRNMGPKEGFKALPEKTLDMPLDCPEGQLVKALEEAFALCM